MRNIKTMGFLCLALIATGCGNHPKDRTHIDDIVYCGFGQEYVDSYTKKNGTKVKGYCRKSN